MNFTAYIFRISAVVCFAFLLIAKTEAQNAGNTTLRDTTVRFPLNDRRSDTYSNPGRNTFDFRDTSYIKRNIEYDPKTKQYYIVEKIGSSYYRTPISFSMQEFLSMQGKKDEIDYFKKRSNMLANMNRKLAVRTTADLVRFAAAHGIAVAPRADVATLPDPGERVVNRRDGLA